MKNSFDKNYSIGRLPGMQDFSSFPTFSNVKADFTITPKK